MNRFVLSCLACCVIQSTSLAAYWNWDADIDRKLGVPNVESILSGRFERHSLFYIRELIRRENALTQVAPTPGQPLHMPSYESIAVAHARLGEWDLALDAMRQRQPNKPSAATYSTEATLHFGSGDLPKAIESLNKSIAIQPRLPFLREPYELMMMEYLNDPTRMRAESTFIRPLLRNVSRRSDADLFNRIDSTRHLEIDEAITGISAMIRHGHPGGPYLYAALGDLLMFQGRDTLAYRAYRRALEAAHPDGACIEQQLAALRKRVKHPDLISDATINRERAAADAWVTAFQAFEDQRLRQDPDARITLKGYEPFYAKHGTGREVTADFVAESSQALLKYRKPAVLCALLALVVSAMLIQRLRRRAAEHR